MVALQHEHAGLALQPTHQPYSPDIHPPLQPLCHKTLIQQTTRRPHRLHSALPTQRAETGLVSIARLGQHLLDDRNDDAVPVRRRDLRGGQLDLDADPAFHDFGVGP